MTPQLPDTPDGTPPPGGTLPRMSPRHAAMLAEMGVPLWWAAPVPPALAGDGLAAQPESVVRPSPRLAVAPAQPTAPQGVAAGPVAVPAPAPVRSIPVVPAANGDDRQALEAEIRACQACDLGRQRRHAVPGMGDPAPDWLVVGEAPGEEEDRQGLPFVGRAGQLLDRMLAAMDLTREHRVYIANVIKCRPPHNRNPDPVEVAQCTPYLWRQVALLRPRIVLAMGRFAAHSVLAQSPQFDPDALRQMPLGKLRGRVHEVEIAGLRLPVVVTYHPAYLLRSPAEKGKAWADLCLAMDAYDQLVAQPQR